MAGKPPDLKLKQIRQPLPISSSESNTMLSILTSNVKYGCGAV
jgi:hypothetical protein